MNIPKLHKIRKHAYNKADYEKLIEIFEKQHALKHDQIQEMTEEESILYFRHYMNLLPKKREI
jgi:hypothetical protein